MSIPLSAAPSRAPATANSSRAPEGFTDPERRPAECASTAYSGRPRSTRRDNPSDGTFHPSRAEQLYDTVEVAAVKLSSEPVALRARLRRAQRREGNAIVADLGGGIHAFKFGRNWRIRFPDP
jgi:hypothetical protein